MKQPKFTYALIALLCVCIFGIQKTQAQEGIPLTMQGIDHKTGQSAISRAAGGTSIGLKNDASLMFLNPSALGSIEKLQVSFGGMMQNIYTKQEQHYGTLQAHPGVIFLFEGLTDQIPDPDTAHINTMIRRRQRVTQADSVQRPFDKIEKNWNNNKNSTLPLQVFVAAPFSLGKLKIVAGLGAAEYANLNWFYQNNNSLSPNVFDVRNGTIQTTNLPAVDSLATPAKLPLHTQWYQYSQYRNGSIYGYGGAFSVIISPRLTVGVGGMLLTGSTHDEERRVGRGDITFYSQSIRLTKQNVVSYTKIGNSDYDGMEFTISGKYSTRYVTFGFSVNPPTNITRKYKYNFSSDSVGVYYRDAKTDSVHIITNGVISGKDEIQLPWRGMVGLSVVVNEKFTLGFEYEMRAYASAIYTGSNGIESSPWLSSTVIRVGAEYRPTAWLALRGGVRQNAELYQSVASALRGENVRYPVYSFGVGVTFMNATLNVAYEYSQMRYVDTWSNAASINNQITNNFIASLSYDIPWLK